MQSVMHVPRIKVCYILVLRCVVSVRSSDQVSQHLQQVLEEIDVYEMRKSGNALQRSGQQGGWLFAFEYAKIQDEQ